MDTTLHLIWGPTSTGKTARSVAIAEKTGAPVLVLDRIQCCPEVTMGSGRPTEQELRGTERVYLSSRPIGQSIISAPQAVERLHQLVDHFAKIHPLIILEGGSVSILQEMVKHQTWGQQYAWTFEPIPMPSAEHFLNRARKRIWEMFYPGGGLKSLLDEMVQIWAHPEYRDTLADIDGYRCIISYLRQRGRRVDEIPRMSLHEHKQMAEDIAQEYWQHAVWQTDNFPEIPPCWR
ncbi:isopentenyl transferase family protein [Lonsdalea quercina]|uniref:isopentenyl transferase family protein n=1 Tax=Lonsdalea quercina TaxID=71657 RepID=UPI003975D0AF